MTAVAGCLSGLNYKCEEIPNIYELTVNEFQSPDRQDEIMEHPRQLSIFLNKMQAEELYPEDLLSKAFSHEFLVHCFGKPQKISLSIWQYAPKSQNETGSKIEILIIIIILVLK